MPESTVKEVIKKKFMDLCQEGINPSDPPQFCRICENVRMEFQSPLSGRIVLLDCDCERLLQMHKEFLENYRNKESKNGIKYYELIDGTRRPSNEDEEKVVFIGRMARAQIELVEHKARRS